MKFKNIPNDCLPAQVLHGFEVCANVVSNAELAHGYDELGLLMEATHLHHFIGEMEEYSDDYYKIIQMTNELKQRYLDVIELIGLYRNIEFDPFDDAIAAMVASRIIQQTEMVRNEEGLGRIRFRKEYLPRSYDHYRGDSLELYFLNENDLVLREVHDTDFFADNSQVAQFTRVMCDSGYDDYKNPSFELTRHAQGIDEYVCVLRDFTLIPGKIKHRILTLLIETVQQNPRKRIEKKNI